MSHIKLTCEPPSHGWLLLRLHIDGQMFEIDASDVPHNPIHDLVDAIENASQGEPSVVWLHLEPDGYFMHFGPVRNKIEFRLDYAENSDSYRAKTIISIQDERERVLMLFWRFLRNFQSHQYSDPHWLVTDFSRMQAIKTMILGEK